MKLLLENWRQYIAEEEAKGCVTVDQLLDMMDEMRKGEEKDAQWEKRKGVLKGVAKILIGLVPGGGIVAKGVGSAVGAGITAAETYKQAKDGLEDGGVKYDDIAGYPILGHLSIDPELIKVLEDDILKKLDEMYEDEVLIKIKGDTCIDKVPSINKFIRSKIAKLTDKHVVIDDESGTGI